MGLAIRGSFSSEDEEFDQSKHKLAAVVRTLKPFKDTVDKVVPENVTGGLSCRISSAMDSVTKRLSEITGIIEGRRLGISQDNPDEGVWLVDSNTGDRVATAVVERSDSQTINCVFNELPSPGMYTLKSVQKRADLRDTSPAKKKLGNLQKTSR